MPDIVNPSLNIPDVDLPRIPTPIDFPKWDRPAVQVPEILKASQDMFGQYPGNDIPLTDFSRIVNEGLTPEQLRLQTQKQKMLTSIIPDIDVSEGKKNIDFRAFKSIDALRYKQNDRLWKKIGFNPDMPQDLMDAQYDHNETRWESIKNVFPKLWATASFQFKNYFSEYADGAEALFKLDASILHDQDRFRDFHEKLQHLEDIYPDYKTDKPVKWYQVLRGDFWEESGSSLGFTLGTIGAALLEGVGITALTGGMGAVAATYNTPRKVFKAISDYYSLRRANALVKGALGANKTVKWLSTIGNVWRLTNGALSEAAYEGFSARQEYLDNFKQAYVAEHGYAPDKETMEKAERAGDKMAEATALWQTPFLMASNAAQFGNIIAPKTFNKLMIAAKLRKTPYKLVVGDGFKATVEATERAAAKGLLRYAAMPVKAIKGSIWEGTEESYQALVSKATTDYYNDEVFNKGNQSLMKSIGAGFDYVTSNTGMKEFMAGFATGAIIQHGAKPFHHLAKPKVTKDEAGNLQYKTNFLNKYLGLGMKSINKMQEEKKYQKIADYLNETDIEKVLKEEGLMNMVKDKRTSFMLAKYLENNDFFNMQQAQKLQLNRFLWSGLVTGKIDLQINKLKQFAQQDFQTLQKFFDLDEADYATQESQEEFLGNFRNFTDALNEKASEFEKIYEGERTKHEDTIESAHSEQISALAQSSVLLDELTRKYNVTTTDELQELQDQGKIELADIARIEQARMNIDVTKFRYYAVAEGVKASVFAQVGMMEDAREANNLINRLNDQDSVHIRYNYELGRLFDRGYRDERLAELIKKRDLVSDETKDIVQDQITAFERLANYLNDNFDKGDSYDERRVAQLIQQYFYAIQKETNRLDNNTLLESRMRDERNPQLEVLKDFIAIQKRQQENLNLLNYLNSKDNMKEYINNQSKILTDFFSDAIDIAEELEITPPPVAPAQPEPPAAPPEEPEAPTAPATPVPVEEVEVPSGELPRATPAQKQLINQFMIAIVKNVDPVEIQSLKDALKGVNPIDILAYRDSRARMAVTPEALDAIGRIDQHVRDLVGPAVFDAHIGPQTQSQPQEEAQTPESTQSPALTEAEEQAVNGLKTLHGDSLLFAGPTDQVQHVLYVGNISQKLELLRLISDQLLDPETAEATGTALGRDVSELIYALNYPKPDSATFRDRLAATPTTRDIELTETGEAVTVDKTIADSADAATDFFNQSPEFFKERNENAKNKDLGDLMNDLTNNLCP